jgi:glycogen debranching enzyme
MPLTASEKARLADDARAVLARNRRSGVSPWEGRAYDFVCPSPGHYPFQWLWDSCFHAVALLHVDPARAARELRGVVAAIRPDGCLPHTTLWERDAHEAALAGYNIRYGGPYWTATTQPPVLAQALERVYRATGDDALLADVLPAALAWHNWWAAARDPDGDGLVSILQPDESGLDASPKYDAALGLVRLDSVGLREQMRRLFAAYDRPGLDDPARLRLGLFDVEDVLVNCLYAQGLRALARLCRRLPERAAVAPALEARAARVTRALLDRSWDPNARAFWDLVGPEDRPARGLTVTSLMPLILPDLPADVVRALAAQLADPRTFWLPYPVPSVAATEPSFDPTFRTGLIWRGPSWVNTNWLLIDGLRLHGHAELARELAERTLLMVARGGMREFFDPHSAEGYGARSFGWTTLVLDVLAAFGRDAGPR